MMRYQFADRVLAFDAARGPTMTVAKMFPATGDCFTGPEPDAVPVSLLVETVAMAGGHLIVRATAGDRLPLLLKVEDAIVSGRVRPGETVTATVTLRGRTEDAGVAAAVGAEGELSVSGSFVLRCRLLYACVRVPGLNVREAIAS